jgi:hypothetical protein
LDLPIGVNIMSFSFFKNLLIKTCWAFGLASLIFGVSLVFSQYSYAANSAKKPAPDVIQPFELTNPAATRLEAYDDVAKLNKDPKALIAAENKEEQAEEKVYKAQQKAMKSAGDK